MMQSATRNYNSFFKISQFQSLLLTLRSSAAVTKISKAGLSLSANCPAQQKIDVMGVKINYEKVGNGPHPVICLPGGLGCIDSDFAPILNKFSLDKFTVVAWDPPGYGKSRPPERDFSGGAQYFHRDATFADGLMKSLGFPKYSALGWSEGGTTGLIQASKFTSVQSLVVWGARAYETEDDMKIYYLLADIDKWSDNVRAPLIKMYGEDSLRKLLKRWIEALQEICDKGGDICKDDLKNIKCPTLIIHGDKDPIVPTFHSEYIHTHTKNSELIILPDAKHNLHIRYADEFVKMVESFLLANK